ncbi:MAG TPA: hypothetical protein VN944_03690 [Nitrospiria bacterium]|nr:hypothetical protein [Nitrospiria bacterium]
MKKTWTIIAFIFFTILCSGALPAVSVRAGTWDIQPGFELRYTDNAIYIYDLATQQTSHDSDLIFEPYVTGRIRLGDGATKTKLSAYIASDFYSTYSPLNNQTYSLLLEQGISAGTALSFRVHLNPYLFVGEEEINSAQNTPLIDTNQSYRLETYTVGLDKDIYEKGHLYFFAKLGVRDFNPVMAYRSGTYRTLGAELSFKPANRRTFLVGLAGETFDAEKGIRTVTTLTPSTFMDDAGYISYGLTFLWVERFSEENRLRSRYQINLKDFTAIAPEPLHEGRVDYFNDLSFTFTHKLNGTWAWKTGLELTDRLTNKDYAYYVEKIISTGIEGYFN